MSIGTWSFLYDVFPYSFGAYTVKDLIMKLVVYLVVGAVIGVLLKILAKMPVVGLISKIVGGLVELYVLIGVIVLIYNYITLANAF